MSKAIISSILDTDLYKFTMMQCVFHNFPMLEVEYAFSCRNKIDLVHIKNLLVEQISLLENLKLSLSEKKYLESLGFFQFDFLDYLESFCFNKDLVKVEVINDDLTVKIKGNWLDTILFEVPILSIINELYFTEKTEVIVDNVRHDTLNFARQILNGELEVFNNASSVDLKSFNFCEFGTRRRYSKQWQEEVLQRLIAKCSDNLLGTSNVYLAKKYNLKPVGTMAHEYLQAFQGLSEDIKSFQTNALEVWLDEYNGKLSIALTDVISMDSFLKDFNLGLADAYQGLRHDSGCPFDWGDKAIDHYLSLNINPLEKTLVFSDGLSLAKATKIFAYFKDRINILFGIGTSLSNNTGLVPLQIVIKMISCNSHPVAKISDDEGKAMSNNPEYLSYLKDVFNY